MPKRILFVCVKNTSRSQMAEALVKMWLPDFEAYSAGIHPGEKVNPTAAKAMRELGYDLTKHEAQHVSAFHHLTFDAVFKMDAPDLSDYVKTKWMENWEIPDPAEGPIEAFRRVREMLAQCVKELARHPALAARQDEPEHAEEGE